MATTVLDKPSSVKWSDLSQVLDESDDRRSDDRLHDIYGFIKGLVGGEPEGKRTRNLDKEEREIVSQFVEKADHETLRYEMDGKGPADPFNLGRKIKSDKARQKASDYSTSNPTPKKSENTQNRDINLDRVRKHEEAQIPKYTLRESERGPEVTVADNVEIEDGEIVGSDSLGREYTINPDIEGDYIPEIESRKNGVTVIRYSEG